MKLHNKQLFNERHQPNLGVDIDRRIRKRTGRTGKKPYLVSVSVSRFLSGSVERFYVRGACFCVRKCIPGAARLDRRLGRRNGACAYRQGGLRWHY